MPDNIISHIEMCRREDTNLQRGMSFGLGGDHSVVLMSLRANAPYRDRLEDNGTTLIYEGHDMPRTQACPHPKTVDQPLVLPSGRPTQNGKFYEAAREFKNGIRPPERVRVYEKIHSGIWSYNGVFHLVDAWQEHDQQRKVFKFRLIAVSGEEDFSQPVRIDAERRRIIPTAVKIQVWRRDRGKCCLCEATDELHFDHVVPFSKGGTSLTAENVQLLCARHNLQKHDRIE